MASKFQNRLVGTVILVAIGVIVLPGLLDGKKKHYKEECAAMPLVPKPDDQQDSEMVPPVTQPLPSQPPEGASAAQQAPASSATQSKTRSRSVIRRAPRPFSPSAPRFAARTPFRRPRRTQAGGGAK